jgi:hypothetical protein
MFDQWGGQVTVVPVAALAAREQEWWREPPVDGSGMGSWATDAARSLECARVASSRLVREADTALSDRLGELAGLRGRVEQLTVAVVLEAANRGAHTAASLSLRDWLSGQLPWASRADISDLATVAEELDRPGHDSLRSAVSSGGLPTRRAARLLRALRQLRVVADPVTYARDVDNLVPFAQRSDVTDRELDTVVDHLLTLALPAQEVEEQVRSQQELRGVNESSLADGSLTRFIITADPEGAAVIRSVLSSPLAAPAPDADGPDPRTASQRRYDALLAVVGRGVASPEGVPTTSKARLVVTVGLDVLTGQAQGIGETLTGETLTGETLSPGQVRRLACTSELIPAVLGTQSEVLDLGRPVRLASPAQLTVLYRRDRHCTYPGCTIPPQWCDAHHVTWYSRGGKTYLDNLALLCGRHHTLVHQRDLSATVGPTGVSWERR